MVLHVLYMVLHCSHFFHTPYRQLLQKLSDIILKIVFFWMPQSINSLTKLGSPKPVYFEYFYLKQFIKNEKKNIWLNFVKKVIGLEPTTIKASIFVFIVNAFLILNKTIPGKAHLSSQSRNKQLSGIMRFQICILQKQFHERFI